MPPSQGGLGHLSRSGRVDSAGIDLDLTALPAEQLPQCRLAPPRVKVPDREVDARDCLRERARLARLQREYRGILRQLVEDRLGLAGHKPDDCRRQYFVDEPGAVLCAVRWKIRPDLAPADMAVLILDANEHDGTIEHLAERRHDRRR